MFYATLFLASTLARSIPTPFVNVDYFCVHICIYIFVENNPGGEKYQIKKIGTRVLVYILIFFFAALPCEK